MENKSINKFLENLNNTTIYGKQIIPASIYTMSINHRFDIQI